VAIARGSGLSVEGELHYSATEQFPRGSELDYLTYARVLLAQGRSQSSASHLQMPPAIATSIVLNRPNRRTNYSRHGNVAFTSVGFAGLDRERSLDYLNQALSIPRHGNYPSVLDEEKPMAELLQIMSQRISIR